MAWDILHSILDDGIETIKRRYYHCETKKVRHKGQNIKLNTQFNVTRHEEKFYVTNKIAKPKF